MLYIVYVDINDASYLGIRKKVFAQIQVLQKYFGKVYYTTYCGQMMYLLLGDEVITKELAITRQDCNNIILKWIEEYSISRTYIRYNYSDKWFIEFLRQQKERGIRSILEFPTVPYDGELRDKRLIVEDRFYREQLSQYLEQATTCSAHKEVFGIPSINLLNGVNIEQHPLRQLRKKDNKIVLLAVASMAKWHGYERMIKGIAEYYANKGEREIVFKLVGEGPELEKYKKLADKYKIQHNVEICGKLTGEKLTEQYNQTDLAVGSLGMYKIGLEQASPIKLSEYCARGIPFIYGYEDLGFNGTEDYLLKVPNDDSAINIRKVIDFYDRLGRDEECFYKMRKDAIERFSWESIFKPVVEYFK